MLLTIGLSGAVSSTKPPGSKWHSNTSLNIYAESVNASVGYRDTAPSPWSLTSSSSSSTTTQLSSPNIINFSGSFEPSSTPSSVQILRKLTVNVRNYPILFLQIDVTQGIGYGIRFFTSYGKTTVPIWNNSDILDHRTGTGQFENIQVNIENLAEQNIGTSIQNISQIQVYVEGHALNATTQFSLILQNMKFLNYPIVPFQDGSNYHSVYLTFDQLPTAGNSSWKLNKIDLGLQILGASRDRV